MFGRYQIAIFRDGRAGSRHMHLRGSILLLFFLAILALIACNIWLWQSYEEARIAQADLANAHQVISDQNRQTVSLAEKITALSQDLERVKKFDSKLRLMMNMEKDPAEIDGPGDFSRQYLPLHRQELAARKMHDFLDRLSESTRLEEVRQQDIMHALRGNRAILASMPTIWPVTGFISSSFGGRISPFGRGSQFHKGLDISNRAGTPIVATAEGKVILAGPDGAYGNSVEIDHGGGIITKYAHMQRAAVRQGEWVRRGQVIGHVGMTGRTTGPHLHYEVRLNGLPVNPMRYILD
ncbi:MAG: M23 family metallopeptidase [Desulfovibrio sp.]|nr:M23 family metallopeptidase [Desulfovibrio sp.]